MWIYNNSHTIIWRMQPEKISTSFAYTREDTLNCTSLCMIELGITNAASTALDKQQWEN